MLWTRSAWPQEPIAARRPHAQEGAAWQVSSRPPVVIQSVEAPTGCTRGLTSVSSRVAANNRAAGRRRTGESQTKLAVKCHHRARNDAFCGEGTAHHHRPPEPAMPDPTADHEPEL